MERKRVAIGRERRHGTELGSSTPVSLLLNDVFACLLVAALLCLVYEDSFEHAGASQASRVQSTHTARVERGCAAMGYQRRPSRCLTHRAVVSDARDRL